MLTQTTNSPTVSEVKTIYTIESGRGNKMFTLWVERSQTGSETARGFFYYTYIRNLSMDLEEAKAKASELTGVPADQIVVVIDSVRPMVYGEDVLRFGKYDNFHVMELTDVKYLNWLAKGGSVKRYNRQSGSAEEWVALLIGDKEKFRYFAQDRLIALGEWVVVNGYKVSKATADKWATIDEFNLTLEKGLHFTHGQKVKGLELICLNVRDFETQYGTMYIAFFMTPDRKIIKYKGGTPWFSRIDKMIVSGTIEHGEYKGIPETTIKRPRITELVSIQNEAIRLPKKLVGTTLGTNPYYGMLRSK